MSTPYSKIYEVAMSKFSDYSFLKLNEEQREAILEIYLNSSQVDFQRVCHFDLTDRDDSNKQYNVDLDNECLEILGLGIAYYWLSSYVLDSELLKNKLSLKDYSYYSPANLLKELQALRDSLGRDFKREIIKYSYFNGDVSSLKV